MSTVLATPLPAAGLDADEAFADSFAQAMAALHSAGGGAAAGAAAIAALARATAAAILDGRTSVDVATLPEADAIRGAMMLSPVVGDAAGQAPRTPLVRSGDRVQLARYYEYERRLAARLRALNRPVAGLDAVAVRAHLDAHFGAAPGPADGQRLAAATAVLRQLCVISGGPGTGKTSTVVKILAILLTLDPGLRVAIAAPTGKAAARVQDSIREQLERMALPDAVKAAMPREPHTLHRLLGYRPGSVTFRYHAAHPLPYDVVVVDEASMLDLALAAKLMEALPDGARLILLGDKDQLSSVEAGAVFSGISGARSLSAPWRKVLAQGGTRPPALPEADAPLGDAVTWLDHSWRFGADSTLGRLSRAINAGDAAGVQVALLGGGDAASWTATLPAPRALAEQLIAGYTPFLEAVRAGRDAPEVFAAFEQYRVLCSTRGGDWGSQRLGAFLLDALRRRLGASAAQPWFAGRPVLVTRNDYALRLFNGDVGIVLPCADGALRAHFLGTDGGVRTLPPGQLGNVDDALAITVHRAQGSELDRVAVVIDPLRLRGLSRALLYTAVTRAKRGASLFATREAIAAALSDGAHGALP